MLPGKLKKYDKVWVFDPRLFVDDVTTPLSVTVKKAIVTRVYRNNGMEVADVNFNYDNHPSKAHFTSYIDLI